jgi:hypothetical protein
MSNPETMFLRNIHGEHKSDQQSTTTDQQTWQDKLVLDYTPPLDGTYRVQFYCELTHSVENKRVEGQITLDGNQIAFGCLRAAAAVADGYLPFSGCGCGDMVEGQTYQFKIQWRVKPSEGGTAGIRRARLYVRRID